MNAYYYKNRDHILKGMKRQTYCDVCNKSVSFCNYPKHCRTRRHKELLGADNQKYNAIQNRVKDLQKRIKMLEVS